MSSSLPLQSEFELADFAALAPGDYEQIVHDAMAAELSGLRLVSDNPEPATVANTIEAWERAELALSRATAAFFTLHDADTSPELDAVAERLSSELAAHHDAIMLDAGLYDRVRDLSQAVEAGAEPGDEQVTWWLHERLRDFRRSGVALSPEDQERLRVLNARIARLESQFGQRVVAGRNEAAVHITDPAELAGLSEEQRTEAERAAGARDLDGWLLELVNTTGQDWLASLSHQEVRRRVFEASMSRGATGGNETGSLVVQLARVRADRAALLGYASHAAYVADGGCAKTVDAIRGLLDPFSKLSVHQASEDSLRFREIFTDLAVGKEFGPWDWSWVASRERARAELDDEALRPYLEFEQVLTRGVFEAAHRLYGITVERREGLTGYTPDVRVYEVHEQDGTVLGLLLLDPWARPSKQGGAWMTDLVNANSLTGAKPVVTLNTNITRPRAGQPALLSWDQVITCFHEFGHCLHGLFADSRYPSLAGTNTPIDYVEFPSQVNERGPAIPNCSPTMRVIGAPVSPCPPISWGPWSTPIRAMSASTTWSSSRRCSSTRPGTAPRPSNCPPNPDRWMPSRTRPSRNAAWPSCWCRRVTGRAISATSGPPATTAPTTPTCGQRSSMPTPAPGSTSTADSTAQRVSASAARCWPPVAPST